MKEVELSPMDIEVSATIKNREFLGVIDTGARRSFINKKLISELNLEKREDKEITVFTANKNMIKLDTVVDVETRLVI